MSRRCAEPGCDRFAWHNMLAPAVIYDGCRDHLVSAVRHAAEQYDPEAEASRASASKEHSTMTDLFTSAGDIASASSFNLADAEGRLVLFKPSEHRKEVLTQDYGPKDAVAADIVILDGPDAGTEHVDCLFFQSRVIGKLKQRVGGMVLARVERGKEKVKGNYPWNLEEPSESDKDVARRWLAKQDVAPF